MYNYSEFLAKAMHEKLMNITTEGVFKYSSVLFHMFIFQQGDRLPIVLHKQDDQQENQAVNPGLERAQLTSDFQAS